MPPTGLPPNIQTTIEDVVATLEGITVDAYFFIQQGVHLASEQVHGPQPENAEAGTRHVTGRQLCETLRNLAIQRWGLMASVVLRSWGLRSTRDIGRLVFAFVDAGIWQKTPTDSIEDFNAVYSFREAFEQQYRIEIPEKVA